MVRNLLLSRSIAFLGILSVAFSMFTVGCGKPVRRSRARKKDSNAEAVKAADTDFQVAFDFLSDFHQFDSKSVGDRITYHLQRWVAQQQPDPDWIADPLITRLPARFASWKKDGELSDLRFDAAAFDVAILRESIWAKDLATQIDAADLHDQRLADWLAAQSKENADQTSELETAAKIFDWTVRNVQLERLPYAAAKIPEGATEDQVEIVTPPDGAMYLPAESLILGRGDWIARTRVANLIARQAGLATVLLAIDQDEGEETPWCWAVLINGQLYLFDFRLGIPIPTESGKGITTLAAVVENPDVLRKLDLKSDDHGAARTYPVSAEGLKRVVALMDATPESLSQRMKIVERQLAGERKLVLTSSPSALAVDLRSSPGITGARLWPIAFEVYLFRQNVNRAIAMGAGAEIPRPVLLPARMLSMGYDMSLVDGSGPMFAAELAEGRRQHFRGLYSDTNDEMGAKTAYMNCRVPDSEINIRVDLETLVKNGIIPQMPANKAAAEAEIERVRSGMKLTKQHASFWLGLIAFEEGKYSVAVNYLEKRSLAPNPNGVWSESATYNLARAYEQWGLETGDEAKIEKSKELFRSLRKAPQATGNRIRSAR